MKKNTAQLLRETAEKQAEIDHYLAVDEMLLFALERRYLGVGEFKDIVLDPDQWTGDGGSKVSLDDRLGQQVRLLQIDEICYEKGETFHLPGVESVLSSMRDCGHSLVFVVRGEHSGAKVYLGLAAFSESKEGRIIEEIKGFKASWEGHFPGTEFVQFKAEDHPGAHTLSKDDLKKEISNAISGSHCGALTGIPSLKREEESKVFVQGIERLIRVLRGKEYTWISIADPVSASNIDDALDACRKLRSEVHELVRVQIGESLSKGKTATLGMFAGLGKADTEGKSFSDTVSETNTDSKNFSQNKLEDYQRLAKGLGVGGSAVGAIIGTCIFPGVGTVIGGLIGSGLGTLVDSIGAAVTGDAGHAITKGTATSTTKSFTDTVSNAVSNQMMGGGFGSMGYTWTRTSTVTKEHLNRKAEYCEELL